MRTAGRLSIERVEHLLSYRTLCTGRSFLDLIPVFNIRPEYVPDLLKFPSVYKLIIVNIVMIEKTVSGQRLSSTGAFVPRSRSNTCFVGTTGYF